MKKKVLIAIIIVFALVFVVSTTIVIRDTIRSHREDKANSELQNVVHSLQSELDQTELIQGTDESGNLIDIIKRPGAYSSSGMLREYESLWKRNNDLAGWITIEGTKIDYPVVYTPNYYMEYLRKAFDGSYAISGTLFIGDGWSDEGNNYTIIYGHNMNDGTMFSDLQDYESEEYAKSHSTIQFDTLYEKRTWTVVTAFYSQISDQNSDDDFVYYKYTNLTDKNTFDEYFKGVWDNALYDLGIDVEYGDYILALSTCTSYFTTDGRFVVIAKYHPIDNSDSGAIISNK